MVGARRATALAAKSGSTVQCIANGTVTTVQVARDLTVATNDVLVIIPVGSEWVAVARMFTAAAAPPDTNDPPPPPKPTVVTGTTIISPVETRSYRSGKWRADTDDVFQGAYGSNGNHIGSVFYGSKPRSLEGATVLDAAVRIRRLNRGGVIAAQSTTLRLVTEATRPSGSPTLGASTAGPSLRRGETDTSYDLPAAWGQALVDGTAGGLAVYEADGDPYLILAGRGEYGPAFTLTLRWTRTT